MTIIYVDGFNTHYKTEVIRDINLHCSRVIQQFYIQCDSSNDNKALRSVICMRDSDHVHNIKEGRHLIGLYNIIETIDIICPITFEQSYDKITTKTIFDYYHATINRYINYVSNHINQLLQ